MLTKLLTKRKFTKIQSIMNNYQSRLYVRDYSREASNSGENISKCCKALSLLVRQAGFEPAAYGFVALTPRKQGKARDNKGLINFK